MSTRATNFHHPKHYMPIDILDDLCCRFIINLPPEDRGSLVRICFQIEQAHWFYLDFYCTEETKLKRCGIRIFAGHIFQHIPELREHFENLDTVLSNWREYKRTVPTYGAILLDTDLTHVLLVQSYWSKASWSFPKGKVNQDEKPWECAIREVQEETSFDISSEINKDDYIEAKIYKQIVRLYIIGYIPRDTKFQPRTRNEIKACEWFPLAELPTNRKDMKIKPKVKMGVSFMVLPFVKRIRRWVAESNPQMFSNSTRRTIHKCMGDIGSSPSKNKVKTVSQGLQNEIQEYQQLHSNTNHKNGNNSGHVCNNDAQGSGISNGNLGPGHSRANPPQEHSGSTFKNDNSHGSNRKDDKIAEWPLISSQNTHSSKVSPIQKENTTNEVSTDEFSAYFNFVAPSWADFKFDMRTILD